MQWPEDMKPTGKSYVGFKEGKAVAISMQFTGKQGEKENRQSLKDLSKYDIQTLPHAEAVELMKRDMQP